MNQNSKNTAQGHARVGMQVGFVAGNVEQSLPPQEAVAGVPRIQAQLDELEQLIASARSTQGIGRAQAAAALNSIEEASAAIDDKEAGKAGWRARFVAGLTGLKTAVAGAAAVSGDIAEIVDSIQHLA